ncbi:MAG: hypothetical protein OEV94_02485 [Deltaproteobacteria bacterium]|nr:hypothetical protein [Deltaproteobacteria bacterium]
MGSVALAAVWMGLSLHPCLDAFRSSGPVSATAAHGGSHSHARELPRPSAMPVGTACPPVSCTLSSPMAASAQEESSTQQQSAERTEKTTPRQDFSPALQVSHASQPSPVQPQLWLRHRSLRT